jgi:hypothetical protein
MIVRILTLALLLGLGACAAYQGVTSGASVPSASNTLDNRQSCVQTCDSQHARCMDSGSARRDQDSATSTIYGMRFDCEAELRRCLPQCQGR